ncbi:MAG: (deoxy)nucleoside triphosphate pyrophosphohydrolase [Bacteroidales bacterium]|jgi:8-oxo-dGTP diphosphatase
MIKVTCAIIRNDENEVLVVQRGEKSDHPLKWEFPGGKVMKGETEEECIIREIREELSIDIVICDRMNGVSYDYGIKQIFLMPFICDTLDDLPLLFEHISYKWLSDDKLKYVDFLEADIIVAENYVRHLEKEKVITDSFPGDNINGNDDISLKSMIAGMTGMKNAEWLAGSATDNPAVFRKLMEYTYSDEGKLAFHAAWILTKACDTCPELINPFLGEIIEKLVDIQNESIRRSFLRIISLSDIGMLNSRQHGILTEYCFGILRSGFSPPAVRVFSMEILYRLSLIYPELASELTESINILEREESAGIKARGRIILKKLMVARKKGFRR